jgi:hypothetical protein
MSLESVKKTASDAASSAGEKLTEVSDAAQQKAHDAADSVSSAYGIYNLALYFISIKYYV